MAPGPGHFDVMGQGTGLGHTAVSGLCKGRKELDGQLSRLSHSLYRWVREKGGKGLVLLVATKMFSHTRMRASSSSEDFEGSK